MPSLFVVVSLYLCIMGFLVAPDRPAYTYYFETLPLNFHIDDTFDIGFEFLIKFMKIFIGGNIQLYYSILALINIILILKSFLNIYETEIEKSDHQYFNLYGMILPFLIYIGYFGFYYNGIVLRQGIALSILTYIASIYYKEPRNALFFLKVLVLLLIALSFHSTAFIGFIALIIFIFSKKFISRKHLLIIISVLFLLYLSNTGAFIGDMLFGSEFRDYLEASESAGLVKINNYLSKDYMTIDTSGGQKSLWQLYLFAVGFLFCYSKDQSVIFHKLLNVFLVGIILISFFGTIPGFGRIFDYFVFTSYLLSFIYLGTLKSSLKGIFISVIIILPELIYVMRIINMGK